MIGLMAIGFVGGFYTHRTISKNVVQKVARLREAPGFQAHLYKMLQPTETQKEELAPILEKYAERMGTFHRQIRHERHHILDSMHQEILPYLDEKQKERLERFGKRFPHAPPPHQKKNHKKKREHREKNHE